MSDNLPKLRNPPVIEAVLDIGCDLPPTLNWAVLEAAALLAYRDSYPKFQRLLSGKPPSGGTAGPPPMSGTGGVQALQFFHEDGKQLVQVRSGGYSFNRLSPYAGLDAYLPEIKRTWDIFLGIANPKVIRALRLAYINRINLPVKGPTVDIAKYLKTVQPPDEGGLALTGFLSKYTLAEEGTGNIADVLLTALPPEPGCLPIILTIAACCTESREPGDWLWIAESIRGLRALKNRNRSRGQKCKTALNQAIL
ncbi:MAG: TIGR04255 family protein [Phycisphaerae bacterium]